MATTPRDTVDRIVSEWATVRPDIDCSPLQIIGRVSRLSRLIDKRLTENFAEHGIEAWMYDVMATLRRIGHPHQTSAGDLVAQTMVTTGAITNRIDRLTKLGYVQRVPDANDRRKVIVRLTDDGLALVDEIVEGHLDVEREILGSLSERQQREFAQFLRLTLLDFGD